LDEDAVRLQARVVVLPAHLAAVDAVLGRVAGGGAAAGHDDARKLHLLARPGLKHQLDQAAARLALVGGLRVGVQQLAERAAQVRGSHAEHEADGIHQVGLAAALRAVPHPSTLAAPETRCQRGASRLAAHIGPNDGSEVAEGTDQLVTAVGLEVLHLQVQHAPLGVLHGAPDHSALLHARKLTTSEGCTCLFSAALISTQSTIPTRTM